MAPSTGRLDGGSGSSIPDTARDPLTGLGREAIWTVLQLMAGAISYVAVAAVAVRRMGAGEFGEAALVISLATLVTVVDVGLGTGVVRGIASLRGARHDSVTEEVHDQIRTVSGLCSGLGVGLGFVTIFGVIAAEVTGAVDVPTVAFAGLGATFYVLCTPATAIALGHRAFRRVSIAATFGAAGNLTVVLAASTHGSVAVAGGFLASVLLQRGSILVLAFGDVPRRTLKPAWLGWSRVRDVMRFGLPLAATALLTQLNATTDMVTLSLMSGAVAVGRYRVASAAPAWSAGALFRVFDVSFPALVQAKTLGAQDDAIRLLGRLASVLGGVGFGLLLAERDLVASVLSGKQDAVVAEIVGVLAISWALNVPAHGLVLVLTSRAQHRFLPALVGAETLLNVALTVVLVAAIGPAGAAWSTLAALAISNLIALPLITRRRYPSVWSLLYRDGVVAVGWGVLVAVGSSTMVRTFLTGTPAAAGSTVCSGALLLFLLILITTREERTRVRALFRRSDAS